MGDRDVEVDALHYSSHYYHNGHHTCKDYCHLIFSAIGVVLGLSACIAFSLVYVNYVAAVYACLSSLVAAVNLMLHILHYIRKIDRFHSPETLDDLGKSGFIAFVLLFGVFVWYLFYAIYYHYGVLPLEDNPYITSVWVFMTSKWLFALWFNCQRYGRLLEYMELHSAN